MTPTSNKDDPADEHQQHQPTKTRPSLPWRTRIAVTVASAVNDASCRPDGTVNRRLLSFLDFPVPTSPTKPIHSVTSADVAVDVTRSLWLRLYTPATQNDGNPLPVLVFFHGGGFALLSPAARPYDVVCRRFAKRLPCVVVSVNYRLTPEHRFPSQYDDGFDALRFLDSSRDDVLPRNADLSKCFLAGDSAGANLAHHVAVRVARTGNFRALRVAGLVSIQPFFGGEERTDSELQLKNPILVSVQRTDWMWRAFLPAGFDRDHYAVNVSGPNAEDISGLEFPDTVVFVGGFDPLQDWQRRYYEWIKRSGKEAILIEYPNMIHAFYLFPELPQSSQLLAQVKDFVDKRLSQP